VTRVGVQLRTFDAFQLCWYRWFRSARGLGDIASRFPAVVLGWLIYNLTGSAFALSAAGSTWGVATLLFSVAILIFTGMTGHGIEWRALW
jgi:hypothetical protein